MKKRILLILISLTAGIANAEGKLVYSLIVSDPQIGSLQLKVEDVLEPTYARYRMTVSKKCKVGDGLRAELFAQWVVIAVDGNGNNQYPKQICHFEPSWNSKAEAWDKVNKELNVRYTVPSELPGASDCSVHNVDTINLREACEQ